jgi:hypothetical protein
VGFGAVMVLEVRASGCNGVNGSQDAHLCMIQSIYLGNYLLTP